MRNKNKPGPSTNMPLPTLKMYHNDPPKMGWPLKTRSRIGKKKTSLKKSWHLRSLYTAILDFDILYYLAMLCLAINYSVNYLLYRQLITSLLKQLVDFVSLQWKEGGKAFFWLVAIIFFLCGPLLPWDIFLWFVFQSSLHISHGESVTYIDRVPFFHR